MNKPIALMLSLLLVFAAGCSSGAANQNTAKEKVVVEDLGSYFTGYDACFVLYDQDKNIYTIYNEAKSQKPIAPCSTFKIVNSLIGLESKVLEDENTVIKWDGTIYPNQDWNKDQTLTSAVQKSAFWYFQQAAAKVGTEKMQAFLNKLDYGNKDISGGLDHFWQQSSLKITPREQVEVLRKIYGYQAPFSKRNIDIVKKILVLSDANGIKVSGKTGSGLQKGQFVKEDGDEYVNGWFVGYVEKENNVYYFAANIEAPKNATGTAAKEITLKILKDKSLY